MMKTITYSPAVESLLLDVVEFLERRGKESPANGTASQVSNQPASSAGIVSPIEKEGEHVHN